MSNQPRRAWVDETGRRKRLPAREEIPSMTDGDLAEALQCAGEMVRELNAVLKDWQETYDEQDEKRKKDSTYVLRVASSFRAHGEEEQRRRSGVVAPERSTPPPPRPVHNFVSFYEGQKSGNRLLAALEAWYKAERALRALEEGCDDDTIESFEASAEEAFEAVADLVERGVAS